MRCSGSAGSGVPGQIVSSYSQGSIPGSLLPPRTCFWSAFARPTAPLRIFHTEKADGRQGCCSAPGDPSWVTSKDGVGVGLCAVLPSEESAGCFSPGSLLAHSFLPLSSEPATTRESPVPPLSLRQGR